MCICWPLCLTSFLILYLHFLEQKSPFSKVTGAQPEIFKSRGGFLELEHFDKPFVKNKREKGPAGKNLGFFCLDTVIWKLHYEWKIWPKKIWFSKKTEGASPLPRLVARLSNTFV